MLPRTGFVGVILHAVADRTFRSLVVPVSGRLAHQRLVGRIEALREAKIRRSSLRRLGSRKRRRLDTPTFESRVVVELFGVGPLQQRTPQPYRGVSRDDIDGIVAEHGGQQLEVATAVVRFTASAFRRSLCERLLAELSATVRGRAVELDARVVDNSDDRIAPFTVPGIARGGPGPVADLSDVLSASPLVLPWDMGTQWHEEQ